ncbi:MAG: serpin family protein, partial [Acidobacteriota bacterium]|nr:serpin family protein [Acidobacteriota bacterium]
AATAVVVGIKMALQKIIFEANHPFIFIIQDNATGNILFMGRVTDPSASK